MPRPDVRKYAELRVQLKVRELKPPPVHADFYLQLIAVHLYFNELTSARFVWSRIPPEIKAGNEHLKQMHYLTSALLSRTPHEFFKYIDWNWPENLKEIMSELRGKIRYDIFKLVGTAYTSIEEEKLSEMTNLTPDKLKEACTELDWQYTKNAKGVNFVLPKKPATETAEPLSSEAQLFQLTDFVSFLEN